MVTTQDVIRAGEDAVRIMETNGHGDHELAECARSLTDCFRRIAAIEAEE